MSNIHYVACNMQSGTIQAINFLINKGHRVIGMINGPEKLLVSQERQEGYKLAMAKNRLKFDPFLIISTDLSTASVHEATRQLLTHKRKPTAIIAFSDYVTQDAVQYARKEKRKINKNICFVSYGNQLINNYTAFPPLASVEQFPYKQGQKAMETLLELICNKKEESEIVTYFKIILDSQLIVHEHK